MTPATPSHGHGTAKWQRYLSDMQVFAADPVGLETQGTLVRVAGLVLEAASQRLASAPADHPEIAEAARLLARAKSTHNAAIRDARGTIGNLTPGALDEQDFPDAVRAVFDHLAGRHTVGVYPLLSDDTCHFLAVQELV